MSSTSPAVREAPHERLRATPWRPLVAAVAAAVLLDLLLLALGSALGATMLVGWGGGERIGVGAAQVTGMTAVPLCLGAVVAVALRARAPRPLRLLGWIGAAFAVATVATPAMASADAATAVTLAAMHLVVAAAWLRIVSTLVGLRGAR